MSASVIALFLLGVSSLPQSLAATSTSAGSTVTLYQVQLSVQTKSISPVSSYDLVAFNSTGSGVASYTGQYPRVTFDLPAGTYLFAATATGPSSSQSPVCCVCAGSGTASPPAKTAQSNGSSSAASTAIAYPCYFGNPPEEYGYSLTQISGAATLVIATAPPSGIPTANVSVSVSFKNGTAVSDAYVYASVVGADWYWGGDSNVTMGAQTSANGVAQLVVPEVPLVVTASDSVQVSLPGTQTTEQVNVGGQLVNVTLYYSPNYVYETATALLVPPKTSLSMVVTAQPNNQLIPYAVSSSSSGQTGSGPLTASTPAQTATQGAAATLSSTTSSSTIQTSSIPPIPASDIAAAASSHPSSSAPGISVLAVGAIAVLAIIAAIVGIAIAKRKR